MLLHLNRFLDYNLTLLVYVLERWYFYLFSNTYVSLKYILKEINSSEVDKESLSFINIWRSQVWVDSCRHLRKTKFNPRAAVSIKFADNRGASEGAVDAAVDAGGPRREYFRLLVRALNLETGIFCRPEDNRIIFPNAAGICDIYVIYIKQLLNEVKQTGTN